MFLWAFKNSSWNLDMLSNYNNKLAWNSHSQITLAKCQPEEAKQPHPYQNTKQSHQSQHGLENTHSSHRLNSRRPFNKNTRQIKTASSKQTLEQIICWGWSINGVLGLLVLSTALGDLVSKSIGFSVVQR